MTSIHSQKFQEQILPSLNSSGRCPFVSIHLHFSVLINIKREKNLVISSINLSSEFNCFICSHNFFRHFYCAGGQMRNDMAFACAVQIIRNQSSLLYETQKMFTSNLSVLQNGMCFSLVFKFFFLSILFFLSAIHLHKEKRKILHIIKFWFFCAFSAFNWISFDFNATVAGANEREMNILFAVWNLFRSYRIWNESNFSMKIMSFTEKHCRTKLNRKKAGRDNANILPE